MVHRSFPIVRARLFTIVSTLSLLLCLATLALWVRSYGAHDTLIYYRDPPAAFFHMESGFGQLSLYQRHSSSGFGYEPGWSHYQIPSSPELGPGGDGAFAKIVSFGFRSWSPGDPFASFTRGIWFPHWFLAMLFAILPAIHLRGILRTRRRNRIGLCPNCGYDLRATPDRCPECGAVPSLGVRA